MFPALVNASAVYKSVNISASYNLTQWICVFRLICLVDQGCGDISRVTNATLDLDKTDENVDPADCKYSLVLYDPEDPTKMILKSGIMPENNYSKQGGECSQLSHVTSLRCNFVLRWQFEPFSQNNDCLTMLGLYLS